MSDKEAIHSEIRAVIEERALDVLVSVTSKLLIGWLPALAAGPLGWALAKILPIIFKPIASELARWGNFIRVDITENLNLSRYQDQESRLKVLAAQYNGGDLSDAEKKANDDYNHSADNLIRW